MSNSIHPPSRLQTGLTPAVVHVAHFGIKLTAETIKMRTSEVHFISEFIFKVKKIFLRENLRKHVLFTGSPGLSECKNSLCCLLLV